MCLGVSIRSSIKGTENIKQMSKNSNHAGILLEPRPWRDVRPLLAVAIAFLPEEQLVAGEDVNAVHPVLDIRYCGELPNHKCQQTATCHFPFSCFVQISAIVIFPDFNSDEPEGFLLRWIEHAKCLFK